MPEQSSSELPVEAASNRQIAALDSRINELETRLYYLEARIPNSNIMSNKFWTRALAIFGHDMSIYLAFYGIIIGVLLLIGFFGAIIGGTSR